MIKATVSGKLRGLPTESGAGRVTAQVTAMSRDGLCVKVNLTARGPAGAALLRFADGDVVEASGPIKPRVRLDNHDQPRFIFDLEAWEVRRLGLEQAATNVAPAASESNDLAEPSATNVAPDSIGAKRKRRQAEPDLADGRVRRVL
jgi:hypothetical protein